MWAEEDVPKVGHDTHDPHTFLKKYFFNLIYEERILEYVLCMFSLNHRHHPTRCILLIKTMKKI